MLPPRSVVIESVFKSFFLSYPIENQVLKNEIVADFVVLNRVFIPQDASIFEVVNLYDLLIFKYEKTYKDINYTVFSKNDFEEIFSYKNLVLVFNIDIFSNIFFYLSGYQEIINKQRDSLNRFNFEMSIQKILNAQNVPVVNILFEYLAKAINQKYNLSLKNRFQVTRVWITHDIDIWSNIKRNSIFQSVKKIKFLEAIRMVLFQKLNSWFVILETLAKNNLYLPTYFLMSSKEKYRNYDNADYDISDLKYLKIIQNLPNTQIGIHPEFETSEDEKLLNSNLEKLPVKTSINRFHFLQFDILKTPSILQNIGIKIDSTLGFNDEIGFRNGISLPFYLFDFQTNTLTNVIEVPLNLMDATLFYAHYQNIKTQEEFESKITPLINSYNIFGGIFTINFHNHFFVEPQYEFCKKMFFVLLQKLQNNNFVFVKQYIHSEIHK